ncbi:conjugal transfer protein TraQ [Photorhabdus asymbiotica]|uniref:conjugal transfer protein TraQ n=1 Tax=Photorhabdus asymbiotica TaxID=291112 RepID=UPI003DA7A01B
MNLDIDKILTTIGQNAPLIVLTIFAIGSVAGIIITGSYLLSMKRQANHAQSMRYGRVIFGICCAAFICSMPEFISKIGNGFNLGYGVVNYGIPNVASKSLYGYGADTVNAALAIARVIGVLSVYGGLKQLSDSNLDGNTDLSSSQARGKGIIKVVCGVLLIFNPEILDSLGITFS